MKTFLRMTGLVLILVFAVSANARAQEFGNILGCVPTPPLIGSGCGVVTVPNPTQQPALPTDLVSLNRIAANGLFSGLYVPLSSFASAQALNQTNAAVATLQNQVQSFANRSAEISAVAASFTVLPPNPGDRFSLAFGAAGGDGTAAGSVSGAYRLTDNSLLFAGYARGATQSMAKGGVALSFR